MKQTFVRTGSFDAVASMHQSGIDEDWGIQTSNVFTIQYMRLYTPLYNAVKGSQVWGLSTSTVQLSGGVQSTK
jgi:hypothetical protein